MIPNRKEHSIAGIYIFRNKHNQKIYVGATNNLCRRYKDYYRMAKRKTNIPRRGIDYAIKMYGIEGFEFEILERLSQTDNLSEREQYWLDTLQPFGDKGYNWSRYSCWKPEMQGERSLTPEKEQKRRDIAKKVSEQYKEERLKPLRKAVYKIDPITLEILQEYPSAAEADRQNGYPESTVNQSCRLGSKKVTTRGYRWAYKQNYDNGTFVAKRNRRAPRAVKQFTLTGDLVKIWSTIKEAADSVGTIPCVICQCCEGKSKQSYGWRWEYVENRKNLPSFVVPLKQID